MCPHHQFLLPLHFKQISLIFLKEYLKVVVASETIEIPGCLPQHWDNESLNDELHFDVILNMAEIEHFEQL